MNNLKSNWRELVALVVISTILFLIVNSLGVRDISESSTKSLAVSIAVVIIGGAAKFTAVLALAWFALPYTFPEAGKFLLGNKFDMAWTHRPDHQKLFITLGTIAILVIAAALCMASS